MQLNVKQRYAAYTHEGAKTPNINAHQELQRTVLACLLWEDQFYETGESIADRIRNLVGKCKPELVIELAIKARTQYRLRHVPLLLLSELAHALDKTQWTSLKIALKEALVEVIQRPDELTEFLAIYWKDKKQPISKQIKLALGKAFQKFDEYRLAKYNRDGKIKLRDVLFMVHAKPKDQEQADLWKRLVDNKLAVPDTWEVALSNGDDKKETFTRLLEEKKLPYMALLRNLRNMHESGVNKDLIVKSLISGAEKSKALPFRFIAAARAVPELEPPLDVAMIRATEGLPCLTGTTIVLVDVSASMDYRLSSKSDITRIDAASALAVLVNKVCEDTLICTFSDRLVKVPPRHGMALIDAIKNSQNHSSTELHQALNELHAKVKADRIIVITDEQVNDDCGISIKPIGKGYMINVGSYENGIGYGNGWVNITGFSEAIVQYIIEHERGE